MGDFFWHVQHVQWNRKGTFFFPPFARVCSQLKYDTLHSQRRSKVANKKRESAALNATMGAVRSNKQRHTQNKRARQTSFQRGVSYRTSTRRGRGERLVYSNLPTRAHRSHHHHALSGGHRVGDQGPGVVCSLS